MTIRRCDVVVRDLHDKQRIKTNQVLTAIWSTGGVTKCGLEALTISSRQRQDPHRNPALSRPSRRLPRTVFLEKKL